MKETLLLFSSFVGGLFLGYLAGILTFLVWGIIKKGLGDPKKMAIPAIFLLGIFGTGLAYLAGIVFQSWPLFLGAAITFAHGARSLFKPEEANEQVSKP